MPESAPPPPAAVEPHSPRVSDRLFASRTVLLFGPIEPPRAELVVAQLLALATEGDAPIRVLVSSPGGHVESADAIHDVIRYIRPEVTILGTGWVASAAALVYAAVPRERRLALPATRFLLHQPLGSMSGPASDVEIEAAQILAVRARLHATFAAACGQPVDRIAADMERNHWMTAPEAVRYGLVGSIVEGEATAA